jgi:hypothetical protein
VQSLEIWLGEQSLSTQKERLRGMTIRLVERTTLSREDKCGETSTMFAASLKTIDA